MRKFSKVTRGILIYKDKRANWESGTAVPRIIIYLLLKETPHPRSTEAGVPLLA